MAINLKVLIRYYLQMNSSRLHQDQANRIITMLASVSGPSVSRVSLNSRSFLSEVPKGKSKQEEQEDILKLKNNNIHIWILIHNLQNEHLKTKGDYKQFLKIYQKSKYFSQKFHVHINRIEDAFAQFSSRIQLSIKCFVYGQVIIKNQLWKKVKPFLQNDLVSQIVVKGSLNQNVREAQRQACGERFNDFKNSNRYSGFVQNFTDALELQKKILNLVLSKLKPNFFIINEYETTQASDNLNSFHDILINTKAYLKQSFDIKSKQHVMDSLQSFQKFIWDQYISYYSILQKQKNMKLAKQRQRQKTILQTFFRKAKMIIQNQYPFENEEREIQFYEDVIRLYTEETVVYKSVNTLCKTVTSKEIFMKIAFFCKFFNMAIKRKGRDYLRNDTSSKKMYSETYYRGSMMSEIEWQSLINLGQGDNKGYLINLAFTSTSRSKQIATKFNKNSVKNNILIQITINKLFFKYYDAEPYCNYLEYYYDLFSTSSKDQQEIIFNCFNVFKVLSFQNNQKSIRVLRLEAFSHLQIIQKKQMGGQITEMQQKILDVIVRIQKTRDYAQQLKQQGKHQELVTYLDKFVESNVDLNVTQTESYIQFMVQGGKDEKIEKYIDKLQQNTQRTAEQQMKLAIYTTIKEEFLQSQIFLQSVIQKQAPSTKQNWGQSMDRCNLRHSISLNKQKIGAYEECFQSIRENLDTNYPAIQISEFLQNIQIWSKFYPYILESSTKRAENLKPHKKRFDIIYQMLNSVQKSQKSRQVIKQEARLFLTLENETNFFIEFFEHQRHKFLNDNDLRRDFQSYKNQFYERVKLKIKIIMFYYQVLIKSQRIQMFEKVEQKKPSQVLKKLFSDFFQTNKPFFQNICAVYDAQPKQKYNYQKSMFLKQYGRFLNGYTNFYQLPTNEKKKLRLKISQLYQAARSNLSAINPDHQQIISLQDTKDSMLEQKIISQKILKISSIYQSTNPNRTQDSTVQIESQDLIALAQQLKSSRMKSASRYSLKHSYLNQNLCYSSVLRTSIQVIQSSAQLDTRQRFSLDFQRLSNRIDSNMNSNVYLKQHTSNALNEYLRASFWYFKGEYEAAMVFIGKSQYILGNKLKATEQRMLQQKNDEKRQALRKKIDTIKQNNQVRIKISILKSKICINYKPNLHNYCIKGLTDQEIFIKQKLFQLNSSLPEIYYYQAYLMYLFKNDNNLKQLKINSALFILNPQSLKLSIKKEFLKYYTLLYSIVDGTEQLNVAQVIEKIATKYKIVVGRSNSSSNSLVEQYSLSTKLVEQYELYYLFKIQEIATQNKISFLSILEASLQESERERMPLYKLMRLKEISSLFQGEKRLKYWQIIAQVIKIKFQSNVLVSYKLFACYFLYIQYQFERFNRSQAFNKLNGLNLQLKILVTKSQRNKDKFYPQVVRKNNDGFQDKIKTILLYSLWFTKDRCQDVIYSSNASSIIQPEFYRNDYQEHENKYFNGLF